MRALDEIKQSGAVSHFVARPRRWWGMVIFCTGMTLLAIEGTTHFAH